ncbi:MAG TPA: hypothetical protein VGE62_00905 [Candidatus Paceibacterota bacterium]
MEYLYHGSTIQGLKTLEPRKRHTPSSAMDYEAIYATPLPAYAAAHSFSWSTDEGVDLNVFSGKDVSLVVPANFKERLQVPISIYKLPADGFEHTADETTGHAWHTKKPTAVLEEVVYPSVEAALAELGVTLTYR